MAETPEKPKPTTAEIERCIDILEAVVGDALLLTPLRDEDRIRLFMAAGRVIRPERDQVRRRIKHMRSAKKRALEEKDRVVRAATSIRSTRKESVFVPPARQIGVIPEGESTGTVLTVGELQRPRECYVCKDSFTRVHFFYDSMCEPCATLNYEKRFQSASLAGQVAVITGARLKIGYQAALMMLRAGARVIVTTRFPQDAALRYARESDFAEWAERLQIHGLDLRHSPSVEAFATLMAQKLDRLDILINNAAQTVRRPPGFYAHLMEIEARPVEDLPEEARALLAGHEELKRILSGTEKANTEDAKWVSEWHAGKLDPVVGVTKSAELSQIPYRTEETLAPEAFPAARLDADLQQVDLRKMNSWRMTLADVPTAELLEVQLVNSVAPFILCAKLKPIMLRDRTDAKHIVNVSAMEGKFARHTKTDKHPHTNMAKAALNMMTLTSARDYARDGIYMNAVDTGWVTDEDPAELSAKKQADFDFQPPLDIVDGAARVCDPFFSGILNGKHSWGNFLKDYFPTEW
ncbi:MAG: SDR family oxidoreductase [Bdellovibrionales bacterium]|nr:SDR family oxidoreductase [Bdellovibrionales bacterium]